MKDRRKRIMKRLAIEELERRAMLAGAGEIAMSATGLGDGSMQDFYKAQVGSEGGGPGGVGMFGEDIGPTAKSFAAANVQALASFSSHFADFASGVGQMAVTTGANTPGIGSFALPIAGPSRAGGTGNPDLPIPTPEEQAADAAIEALLAESGETPLAAQTQSSPRQKTPETKTAEQTMIGARPAVRRSWDIEPEAGREDARPVGAKR
jgi:hypothetical protein